MVLHHQCLLKPKLLIQDINKDTDNTVDHLGRTLIGERFNPAQPQSKNDLESKNPDTSQWFGKGAGHRLQQ